MTTIPQEQVCVHGHNTGLVRLGDISKDNVDHTDQHAVLVGVTGILNNWNNVGALLCHVNKVTTGTVGEFDGVDKTGRANDVSNVRDGGTRCGAEVQDFLARADVDVVYTTEDTSCKLGTERVPHTVFSFCAICVLIWGFRSVLEA